MKWLFEPKRSVSEIPLRETGCSQATEARDIFTPDLKLHTGISKQINRARYLRQEYIA